MAGAPEVQPGDPVLALAEAAGWPVLADPLSGLRSGPLAVSTYDALLRHQDFARRHGPELVLRLGGLGTSKALAALLDPGVRQILLSPDGAWSDPDRGAAWTIQADPGLTCGALAGMLGSRAGSAWLESWIDASKSR